MSKQHIENAFQEKQTAGKKLFIPYIMAGDGGLNRLEERLQFLQDSGAAAVELGIPFSDPVADGPTIQDAGIRSLNNGTTLTNVLETVKDCKEKLDIPIIFMVYLNPIFVYGTRKFAEDCADAGVDGVIIPDLPLEEEAIVKSDLQANNIALIRLAALTSPTERLQQIAERTEGFLYAVSVTGTTGARAAHQENVKEYLQTLKGMTDTPVLAGFGVSTPEQAQDLGNACDGVVVGSKIVDLFNKGKHEAIKELITLSIQKNESASTQGSFI